MIIKSVLAICITAVTITVLPKSSVIDNTKSIDVFSPAQIVYIQFLESLILAQDERWRRA